MSKTPKMRFPMLMICPMFLSPSSLESGREEGYFYHSPWKHTPEQLGNFAWNLNHAKIILLEHWNISIIRNIWLHSSLKSKIFVFANFFPCFIDYVIRAKYILLELKAPLPIRAISETYNRGHDILEILDIIPNVSFTTSKMESD